MINNNELNQLKWKLIDEKSIPWSKMIFVIPVGIVFAMFEISIFATNSSYEIISITTLLLILITIMITLSGFIIQKIIIIFRYRKLNEQYTISQKSEFVKNRLKKISDHNKREYEILKKLLDVLQS